MKNQTLRIQVVTIQILLTCALLFGLAPAHAMNKPNIVLVFLDNFGWGVPGFNGGGIIRYKPPKLSPHQGEL